MNVYYFLNCGDNNKTEVKMGRYKKKFTQFCIEKNWWAVFRQR